MRALGTIVCATVLVVGSARADQPDPPAAPDPDRDLAVETARLFVMGMTSNESSALVAMMDTTVRHALATDVCGRGFRRPGKVARAQRKKLAACLIKLGWSEPRGLESARDGKAIVVTSMAFGGAELRLRFQIARGEAKLVGVVHVPPPEDEEDGDGDDGEVGGVVGGVFSGSVGLPPPPPPPPPPRPPQFVAPSALEALRLAGSRDLSPSAAIAAAMAADGRDRVNAVLKLCITAGGSPATITILKSSGYPDWDDDVRATIRTTWRWKPFAINGRNVAVCSALSLMYAVPKP